MKPATGGLSRIFNAFRYSCQGLQAAWRHEAAFRQELTLIVCILPPGLWFANNAIERVLLASSLLLVVVVELLNSAIEAIVDRASPEKHELAGRAKDTGSAAVLVALLIAGLTWLFIFAPRLIAALR